MNEILVKGSEIMLHYPGLYSPALIAESYGLALHLHLTAARLELFQELIIQGKDTEAFNLLNIINSDFARESMNFMAH